MDGHNSLAGYSSSRIGSVGRTANNPIAAPPRVFDRRTLGMRKMTAPGLLPETDLGPPYRARHAWASAGPSLTNGTPSSAAAFGHESPRAWSLARPVRAFAYRANRMAVIEFDQ